MLRFWRVQWALRKKVYVSTNLFQVNTVAWQCYFIYLYLNLSFNKGPTERIDAVSKKIEADTFSNSTFSCLAVDYYDECHLEWFFNESQLSLTSSDKYKIESAQNSKCKKAFNLTVMNVTFSDKGNYSCRQLCGSETFTASIKLIVYDRPPGKKAILNVLSSTLRTQCN